MAEQESLIFNLKVDTGNSAQELLNVEESLGEIEDSIKDINGSDLTGIEQAFHDLNTVTEENNLTFKELGTAAEQYLELATRAGKESPVGKEAIKRAAELKSEEEAITAELDRMVQGGRAVNEALEIGAGVTAGYTAFASVTALTGVENEKLMETLTKLEAAQGALAAIQQLKLSLDKRGVIMQKVQLFQSKAQVVALKAQAIAQRLLGKATGVSTKATNLFGKALIATGLGAIAVAIGLLIANWDKLTHAVNNNTEGFKKFKKIVMVLMPPLGAIIFTVEKIAEKFGGMAQFASGIINAVMTSLSSVGDILANLFSGNFDEALDGISNFGADVAEGFNEGVKKKQAEIDEENRKIRVEAEVKTQKRILQVKEAAGEDTLELQRKIQKDELSLLEKGSDDYLDKLAEINAFEAAEQKKADDKAKEAEKKKAEERKRAAEKRKKEREKEAALRREEQKTLEDLQLANIEDADARQLAQLQLQNKRELESIKEKYGEESVLLDEARKRQANEEAALVKEIADRKAAEQKAIDDKEANDRKAALEKENIERKAALELRVMQIQDEGQTLLDAKKALLDEDMRQQLENDELTASERLLIEEDFKNQKAKLDEEEKQRVIANEKALKEAKMAAGQETLNALAAIGNATIKDEKKREAFQKKIAAVQLAIDTAKAISSTIAGATAAAATGGPAAPFLLVSYIASGIATVFANFKQAQALLSKAGASGGATLSGAGGGGVSAGAISQDVATGAGAGDLSGTNVEDIINGDKKDVAPIKVAVLESDITDTQNRVAQVDALSTI